MHLPNVLTVLSIPDGLPWMIISALYAQSLIILKHSSLEVFLSLNKASDLETDEGSNTPDVISIAVASTVQ